MPEISSASPVFVPRLNFMTGPSPLAGDYVAWGDCVECMGHILIALKIADFNIALVLVDADWQIAALVKIPLDLKKCHPVDAVGAIGQLRLRIVNGGERACEGLLCVEQAWHRRYLPDPPQAGHGGTDLRSANCSWYRFTCRLGAEGPSIAWDLVRTDQERAEIGFCAGGEHGYWFSSTDHLPPPQPLPIKIPAEKDSALDMAEADAAGLPTVWRSLVFRAPPSGKAKGLLVHEVRPLDRDHAVCLATIGGKLHLAPVRLADGEVLRPHRFMLPAAYNKEIAWTHSPDGGGTIWFIADNGKRSTATRDSCIWRVDYGANLVTAKRAADAISVTRLSEDRVVREYAVLDYGSVAVAMWQDGVNIKKPNVLHSVVLHRLPRADPQAPPAWRSEAADEFLPSLPPKAYSEAWDFGPHGELIRTRQFPCAAFRFGKHLGAAVLCQYFDPYRAELTIGEVTFDVSGTGLFDHP